MPAPAPWLSQKHLTFNVFRLKSSSLPSNLLLQLSLPW